MKAIKYSLLFAFMGVFGGCGEFLEPKSTDEYVPENAASIDEMLVGSSYTHLVSNVYLFHFHNILDDDVTITPEPVGYADYEQKTCEALKSVYTLQPTLFYKLEEDNMSCWLWNDYYEKILGTNAALDYIDEVKDDKEMKDFVKAQAFGLRAFYYFHLVNLFGAPYTYDKNAPGVPLKLSSGLTVNFTQRHSVGAVYEQIVKDLKAAEHLFENLPVNRQFSRNYRINLPTVQLLLARTYLFMGDWENAVQAAKRVLGNENFSLYDLTAFVTTDNLPKPNYSDYDNGESMWHFGVMADIHGFTNRYTYSADRRMNRKLFNASAELLKCYEEGDLRKELYILDEYSGSTSVGNKLAMGKVLCNKTQIILSGKAFGMSMRLSEAYLILSEAYAMQDKSKESLYYLNLLREKRIAKEKYSPKEGLKGEDLIQYVREERRRELCFEGYRWFDLRRWGMKKFVKKWKLYDEAIQEFVIEDHDPAFTLPIPQAILDRNPGLEQNPLTPARFGV